MSDSFCYILSMLTRIHELLHPSTKLSRNHRKRKLSKLHCSRATQGRARSYY
jgi:hypothetical protein